MMYCLGDFRAPKSSSEPSPLCTSTQRQVAPLSPTPPPDFQQRCKGGSGAPSQFLFLMEGGAGQWRLLQNGLLEGTSPRAPRGQLAGWDSQARSAARGAASTPPTLQHVAQVGCTELLLAPGLGDVHVYKAVCSWPGPKGHRKPEILPALVPPPHKK